MSVTITFYHPEMNRTCDLEVPAGFKDLHEIEKFLRVCDMSRAGRRSALRAAKRQYKEFGDAVWDNKNGGEANKKN